MDSFELMINRFPKEIVEALKNTEQNPKYHPEGQVYWHIKKVFNALRDNDLKIAALFHDLGKIQATKKNEKGQITSIGHEKHVGDYIKTYKYLFPEAKDWNKISIVCANHMKAHLYDKKEMRETKMEAFKKLPYFDDIMTFQNADVSSKQ